MYAATCSSFPGLPAMETGPIFLLGLALATLFNAAIVSRVYGIPAVVGIKNATGLIIDGQRVEVDGTNGEVTT